MQTEFTHNYTTTIFISREGQHTLALMSYEQAPISMSKQNLVLRAGVFCERLFRGNLPFIAYFREDTHDLIDRTCAKIHKNVYLLPIELSRTELQLTEASILVCNARMWDLIKNEDFIFDAKAYHKAHNVYQLCILP